MKKTLVIGYGNPLRGDDGVGWVLAEELEKKYSLPQVECQMSIQLVPEMAARFGEFDQVLFIDAAVSGNPGYISINEVKKGQATEKPLNHEFDFDEMVSFAEMFHPKIPKLTLFTVTGSDFSFGAGLSDDVVASIPEAMSVLENLIN